MPATSEASIVPAVITAAAGASNSKLFWIVQKADGKLAPAGIALVTTKQLVVQGSSVVAL